MKNLNETNTNKLIAPEPIMPWDIDTSSEKWLWAVNYITTRSFYKGSVWGAPKEQKTADQIKRIVQWSLGTRNFILCFSPSPLYMRKLYMYVTASWTLTTGGRAEIADIDDLQNIMYDKFKHPEKREALQEADLLCLPYAERGHSGLNSIRGSVSNMLMKRRTLNKSTIVDLFVGKRPVVLNEDWFIPNSKRIIDNFGELAYDLFYGENAKYAYVSVPERG
jgi:hypothetical protein